MKRIVVVGLGSMGKRRLRLIREIAPEIITCGVDAQESRRKEAEELFGIECYSSIAEALSRFEPEAGFVCTSPLAHSAIIRELLTGGLHVFTEINLVSDGYRENLSLAAKMGKKLFLSSTFLYRKDVQYIIGQVRGRKMNYIIHTGQYLPDWHPWESYKNFFVGNVRTNGCREILAIDLPWILEAFGPVKDLHVRKSKDSSLELDYEDSYILSMEHENGSKGVFVCDLLSRKAGRNMVAFSEDMYIQWAGTPDSLTRFDLEAGKSVPVVTYDEALNHRDGYAGYVIENAYKAEIQQFFDMVEKDSEPPYGFEDDLYSIALINRIEGRE